MNPNLVPPPNPLRVIITRLLWVAVPVIAAIVGYNIYNSYGTLAVQNGNPSAQNIAINIYKMDNKVGDGADIQSYVNAEHLVKTTTTNQTTRLKKGNYVVVASVPDGSYDQATQQLTLTKRDQQVIVNLHYTDEKLTGLLDEQEDAIHQAIHDQLPLIKSKKYRVGRGRLFNNGDWYGTTLIPTLSAAKIRVTYFDHYRVIAHKEADGSWKVITIPPELIVTTYKYPQVPRDTLSEINKMGLN